MIGKKGKVDQGARANNQNVGNADSQGVHWNPPPPRAPTPVKTQGYRVAQQPQQPPQPSPQMQPAYQTLPFLTPANITSDNKIGARFMMRSKIGDGLSLAALITGALAIFFTSISFMSYSFQIMLSVLPLSISAMVFGVIGTRLQRLVTRKFGIGVAGAALGLVSFLTFWMTFMLFSSNYYYYGW